MVVVLVLPGRGSSAGCSLPCPDLQYKFIISQLPIAGMGRVRVYANLYFLGTAILPGYFGAAGNCNAGRRKAAATGSDYGVLYFCALAAGCNGSATGGTFFLGWL